MGEATYYIKARFKEGSDMQSIAQRVNEFIAQARDAEDYWQNNRDMERSGKRIEFWDGFVKSFPLVYKYLASIGKNESDCNNGLAGLLCFGQDEEAVAHGNELWFYAYTWHFADWFPFADYLGAEFGAVKIEWFSDEDLDPFDLLFRRD